MCLFREIVTFWQICQILGKSLPITWNRQHGWDFGTTHTQSFSGKQSY